MQTFYLKIQLYVSYPTHENMINILQSWSKTYLFHSSVFVYWIVDTVTQIIEKVSAFS